MRRRGVLAGTAGSLMAGLAGCLSELGGPDDERRTETRTYDPAAGTVLRVSNRNGPVTVEGTDDDTVAVDITLEGPSSEALDAVSITESDSDGALGLETEHGDGDAASQVSVSLSIRCPADVPVGRLETTNGPIEATDVSGDPELESTNGDVTARNVTGTVSLTTTSGSITARTIGGVTGASTTNGSIDVDVPAVDGDVTIETANGSIDAALAPTLDVALSASTTNGSVGIEGVDLSGLEQSGTDVSGTLGDGTHALSVTTDNGSIDLRSLPE